MPLPAVAPVMPPVTVPTVQLKVLAMFEVSEMFVALPLQIVAVDEVVTVGFGFTVTDSVVLVLLHAPTLGSNATR